jgi:dienelactone hydrolase
MRCAWLVLSVFALATGAACGGGDERAEQRPRPPGLFAYDRSAPLAVRDLGVINRDYPIKVHDISFASPRGGRVPAYLVVPPGKGPYPAVIYLHGAGGSRLDFVVPATWLAARRAVALTIESSFVRSGRGAGAPGLAGLRRDRELIVQDIVDLRRAVDYLQSLPQVDRGRIGFVGYSAGARTGAILAGAEGRIRTFVLMAGGAPSVAEFSRLVPPPSRASAARILADTDALRHIRKAASGTRFLFQNGLRDEVVPRAALEALTRAAPEPKDVRWYDDSHGLSLKQFRDHLDWLARKLRITGPKVEGARMGP